MPWRLPYDDLALFPPEELHDRAAMPSGIRLRFAMDAESLIFETEPMAGPGNLDLYANDALVSTMKFDAEATSIGFQALPQGMKTLELWLHQQTPFRLRAIHLPEGAALKRAEEGRPRWITYGSSITNSGAAASPSFTWPGIVAREKGLNLTSLGFGGQCLADPMIARLIRDLPAELISVKLGINIYGCACLNERSFLPAVIGTLATIRDKHPETPLIACSAIWSPDRESKPNVVGMTLQMMRAEVAKAVDIFRQRGDRQIFYVDGLKLFGPELAQYLPDGVHPDAEGYRRLGQNFVLEVFDHLGVRPSC